MNSFDFHLFNCEIKTHFYPEAANLRRIFIHKLQNLYVFYP